MPKRSTPFQAIVRLVRQHFAQPGATVTESKLLRDSVLGVQREVDIVIEGEFDGEPMVVSVEVIEHGRKATLPWVQEMLQKHRNLPTNRLLLVSKSGFSATALAAVDREAGRVQALQPEMITVDGRPVIKSLFIDTINYSATGCNVQVFFEGDDRAVVPGQPDTDIYEADGTLLGPLAYLVHEAIHMDLVASRLSVMAHLHEERDQVVAFSCRLAMPQLGYYLRRLETGQLHRIEALEIWGDFAFAQTEVPLALTQLGERLYGAAEASLVGRPTVWVGTTDQATQSTTISWQTTDVQGPPQRPAPFRPIHFPRLIELDASSLDGQETSLPTGDGSSEVRPAAVGPAGAARKQRTRWRSMMPDRTGRLFCCGDKRWMT
ncbi:hypothetical protein NLX85_02545 [Micromonospora sp. A3M-1-15]|uniref:hypothetical protein n=1 Tax=Micromonospora sp. A3M-1-15 TaxID=2962035 RepID=UPI0020B80393|nr:hypothetical protein [Micromonospora sp. A3M-1-15]MCP3782250.1 hypothetical protein [Micromonospora sp. A3M-1-15]